MATNRNVYALCDNCGFRYKLRSLKKTSYGTMVCPTDYDGAYDLKNHPQNKTPRIVENFFIKDIRPDPRTDIQSDWEALQENWEDTNNDWNLI